MKISYLSWVLCAAVLPAGGQTAGNRRFDARAIFQPGMSTLQAARERCATVAGQDFGRCFVDQMQHAGASPEAVAFMHAVENNGFMRDFEPTGRVDIAFADYPFAANENQHCLLVNGTPYLIDVDDYNLLPKTTALMQNPKYRALARKHPNLAIFPGDRSGTKFIQAQKLPDGGQRFLVPYVLTDGCHACARPGRLQLAFNFDPAGKFASVTIADIQPSSE